MANTGEDVIGRAESRRRNRGIRGGFAHAFSAGAGVEPLFRLRSV